MVTIHVDVACYAGRRADQTPRRFRITGRAIEVTEVLDRLLAPEHRYFKLRGSYGATYILRQDSRTLKWELNGLDRP